MEGKAIVKDERSRAEETSMTGRARCEDFGCYINVVRTLGSLIMNVIVSKLFVLAVKRGRP